MKRKFCDSSKCKRRIETNYFTLVRQHVSNEELEEQYKKFQVIPLELNLWDYFNFCSIDCLVDYVKEERFFTIAKDIYADIHWKFDKDD